MLFMAKTYPTNALGIKKPAVEKLKSDEKLSAYLILINAEYKGLDFYAHLYKDTKYLFSAITNRNKDDKKEVETEDKKEIFISELDNFDAKMLYNQYDERIKPLFCIANEDAYGNKLIGTSDALHIITEKVTSSSNASILKNQMSLGLEFEEDSKLESNTWSKFPQIMKEYNIVALKNFDMLFVVDKDLLECWEYLFVSLKRLTWLKYRFLDIHDISQPEKFLDNYHIFAEYVSNHKENFHYHRKWYE